MENLDRRIIVEGVDGSGKSTLCNQLKQFGYRNVSDRSFITDVVYRLHDHEVRRGDKLSEALKELNGAVVIFCDNDTCFYDSMRRGEDNIVNKSDSDSIRRLYKIVLEMLKTFEDVPVHKYDWHTDSFQDLTNKLEAM